MAKKVKLPTIQEEVHSARKDGARASWWRINIAKMTVQELSHATGYSTQAIYLLERGLNSNGSAVSPWTMQRYKMACAGVHYEHSVRLQWRLPTFNWGIDAKAG